MNHSDFSIGTVYLFKLTNGNLLFGKLECVLPEMNVGYVGGCFHAFQPGLLDFANVSSFKAFDGYTASDTYRTWGARVGLCEL